MDNINTYDSGSMPKKQILSAQIDLKKFKKASDEEKRQQDVMSESRSFFRDGMRKLMKNPLAVMSMIILLCILITIIVAPLVVPYGYEEILSVNGKRDKGGEKPRPVHVQRGGAEIYRRRGVSASRTSSARTSSAATILSALCTARACRCSSASSQA